MMIDDGEPHGAGPQRGWTREIPSGGWWVIASAFLAWTFEVYDLAILSVLTPVLLTVFDLTKAQAGGIASVSALGSIMGGILFGYLADRFGRVRTLYAAILIYSALTGFVILARDLQTLMILRFLGGIGMGGAWSAAAALVAETWPARHRGKGGAIMQSGLPIGSALAIGLAALVTSLAGGLSDGAWRWLFAIGALPAIILLPVILKTPESPVWLARRGRTDDPSAPMAGGSLMSRRLVIAFLFVFCVQFVFWGVATWTPTFLIEVKKMTFMKSLGFTFAQQVGTLLGFIVMAMVVDRIGRRPTFVIYLMVGAVALAVFVLATHTALLLLATAMVGFGIGGIFGGLGPFIAEMLKDTRLRALGMAIAYNGGRVGALIAPVLIGAMGATSSGFQAGMGLTIVALLAAVVIILIAPETKGVELS